MRADIPLADQVVQVGHACLAAGRCFEQPEQPCNLVVLTVPSEARLHLAVGQAEWVGVRSAVFFEPDEMMGYTAACTEPVQGDGRRLFRRFPLWRGPPG